MGLIFEPGNPTPDPSPEGRGAVAYTATYTTGRLTSHRIRSPGRGIKFGSPDRRRCGILAREMLADASNLVAPTGDDAVFLAREMLADASNLVAPTGTGPARITVSSTPPLPSGEGSGVGLISRAGENTL